MGGLEYGEDDNHQKLTLPRAGHHLAMTSTYRCAPNDTNTLNDLRSEVQLFLIPADHQR
jgi:hypothetical protein